MDSNKTSKVALCPKCDRFVLAAHLTTITRSTEKEFTELSNKGFIVKTETEAETRERKYSPYRYCIEGLCI